MTQPTQNDSETAFSCVYFVLFVLSYFPNHRLLGFRGVNEWGLGGTWGSGPQPPGMTVTCEGACRGQGDLAFVFLVEGSRRAASHPRGGECLSVPYQKSPGRGKRESIWIFSSINNAIKVTSICRRRRNTNVPKQWCVLIASNSDQFYCRLQEAASSGGSILSFCLGGPGLVP